MLSIGIKVKAWWNPKARAFKMENIILKNMKIMENMSNTLEEMKNYVNEIMEELIEKAILVHLEEGFRQNQISLQEGNKKNPSSASRTLKVRANPHQCLDSQYQPNHHLDSQHQSQYGLWYKQE